MLKIIIIPKKAALQPISSKTVWFKQWLELAHGCGIEISLDVADISNLKADLYRLIISLGDQFRKRFQEEAAGSLYRTIYSRLNHNLQGKNYSRDDHIVEEISMMMKLRGELIRLNNVPHREELLIMCTICIMAAREDFYHFVGKYLTLRETRRYIYGSDFILAEQMLPQNVACFMARGIISTRWLQGQKKQLLCVTAEPFTESPKV